MIRSVPADEIAPRPAHEQAGFHDPPASLASPDRFVDLCLRRLRLADHDQQRFVLDHVAKPDIRNGAIDAWRADLFKDSTVR